MTHLSVLDPQISYDGLKADYTDDFMLSDHLEQSKAALFNYFNENYASANTLMSFTQSMLVPTTSPIDGSPQKSFTARYHRKEKNPYNELKEHFKLPAEDFDACNPIYW
jgi:hypothetical protein